MIAAVAAHVFDDDAKELLESDSGGSGHEDESSLFHCDGREHRGQSKISQVLYFCIYRILKQ